MKEIKKIPANTKRKVERIKLLIGKYKNSEKGIKEIVGGRKAGNDKVFATLNEMNDWLLNNDLYREFTDKELIFLGIDINSLLKVEIIDNFLDVDLKGAENEEIQEPTTVVSNEKEEKLQETVYTVERTNEYKILEILKKNENSENFLKLLENLDKLIELVDGQTVQKLNVPKEILEMKTFATSVRVSREALEEFNELCGQYGFYPKHALLTMALLEFVKKYKF